MTSKLLLRKRLGTALGKEVSSSDFTWFFGRFCEYYGLPAKVRTAKQLDEERVLAFSEYAGYDLRFPIPLPLLEKK